MVGNYVCPGGYLAMMNIRASQIALAADRDRATAKVMLAFECDRDSAALAIRYYLQLPGFYGGAPEAAHRLLRHGWPEGVERKERT